MYSMCVLPLSVAVPSIIVFVSFTPEEIAGNGIFEGMWFVIAMSSLTLVSAAYFLISYAPKIRHWCVSVTRR